jgi:hypothetical protein
MASDHTAADMTRAFACAAIHDDLVVCLDTVLLFLGEARRDGADVLPGPSWHGWKHFENIRDRAKAIPRLEVIDD